MPVTYTKSGGEGHVYQVPDYAEAADGPKGFKDFADFLDLILPPVGSIMPYVGATAPTGWLVCDGSSYSSTSYPKLSALCGTKFGTAGTGLFKVPDLRGRTMAGLDSSQTEFATIGKTGGAKSVTLTTSNLPAHDHTMTGLTLTATTSEAPGHEHAAGSYAVGGGGHGHIANSTTTTVNDVTASTNSNTSGGGNLTRVSSISQTKATLTSTTNNSLGTDGAHTHTFSGSSGSAGGHSHTISGTISGSVDSTGSGTALNVLNPYITMNHIIRAA